MDATATIIFMSRKMRCLFKGGYHSRYASHALLLTYYSIIVVSQVDEAFFFDSIYMASNALFFSIKAAAIPSSSCRILYSTCSRCCHAPDDY